MPPPTSPDLASPLEVPRDLPPITIAQANAITLVKALTLAQNAGISIGKSTLQRWAMAWAQQPQPQVKSVLQVTRDGRHYEIDRDDFEAWLLEQQRNRAPVQDPARSHATPQDLGRPRETSRDPARPHEVSGSEQPSNHAPADDGVVAKLQNEKMQLTIDLEVRKRLLEQAKVEMDRVRNQTETLLRENGALQLQVRQLEAGERHPQLGASPAPDEPSDIHQGAAMNANVHYSDLDEPVIV